MTEGLSLTGTFVWAKDFVDRNSSSAAGHSDSSSRLYSQLCPYQKKLEDEVLRE